MRAAADSHHPPVPENEFSQSSRFKRASKRLRRLAAIGAVWRIRSERQLMEQLDYNLLYRWFVGLSPDDLVWDRPCSRRTATGCRAARYSPSS